MSESTTASLGNAGPPLPGQLSLVVVSGPDQGLTLPIAPGSFQVGKSAECDLVLNDEAVSRRHLEVVVQDDRIEVRDLESKNGSYYLGARFQRIQVVVGAQITIGSTLLAILASRGREEPLYPSDRFGRLVGQSVVMRRLFAELERLSRTDASIVLSGETGTGKDLAAQAVHGASKRSERPFVVCDIAAISGHLIEAELFGHVQGAFTGADRDRAGAFELADGGTIFLDEIGELELALQPRLLRLLETSTVRRLGTGHYLSFDVRVVAATNRDLAAEVEAQRFRADLFHRLAVAQVRVPPLRERLDDIPLLVDAFLDDLARRGGRRLAVPRETVAALSAYHWPGNVRQLRNVLERAVALSPAGELLGADVLGIDVRPEETAPPPDPDVPFKDAKERLIEVWEREYVKNLLERCAGNVTQAARVAGLDRAHLYRILRKYGHS
jgi:two-component system nitrogen regulation response regulator GlnG